MAALGAAWKMTPQGLEASLSIKLDDPPFPAVINAAL